MEPTGYYGADYMSAIYGADFCRTYTEPISMVGHRRSWLDTHDYFKGMWNYRRYTMNYSLYRKRKETERHACIAIVHTHVAYMIDMCSVNFD